jgi:hypothetical protein
MKRASFMKSEVIVVKALISNLGGDWGLSHSIDYLLISYAQSFQETLISYLKTSIHKLFKDVAAHYQALSWKK